METDATSGAESRQRPGLSDAACRAAEPRAKPWKLYDAGGLYLLIQPSGARLWRLKYRFAGKERLLAIGAYRSARGGRIEVTLAEARQRRDEARRLLRDGLDPMEHKRGRIAEAVRRAESSFERVALEWISKNEARWSAAHADKVRSFLAELYGRIGARPVDSITAPDLLAALAPIEQRGALETLRKTRQLAGQVFDYAQRTRGTIGNPAAALRGALQRATQQRYKFLARGELGAFVSKARAYGNAATSIALRLQLLTAARPGEVRAARWQEFDLRAKGGPVWRIPAERMKSRRDHVVPLSRQAVGLLRELANLQGSEPGALLFPSTVGASQPISENTLGFAIRRLGFAATAHGARHTFSTIANEDHLARPEVIEAALAHAVPGTAGRYNTAEYVAERRELLQRWADLLDSLETAKSDDAQGDAVAPQRIKRVHRAPQPTLKASETPVPGNSATRKMR